MDNKDKLQNLRNLSERQMRQDLLIPLLGRMKYRAATEYNGAREHGKDIVCFDDDKLGQRRYLAIVAKISDLTGSVSSNEGLRGVLYQTEQCFNEPYHDLFGMNSITMNEVWIVTTGRVVPGAADSVFGMLEKTNLAKLTRVIAGGSWSNSLINIIRHSGRLASRRLNRCGANATEFTVSVLAC